MMNEICRNLVFPVLFLGMLPAAVADTPKKQPIGRYSVLWSKSPFTTPPEKDGGEQLPSRLDDYVLTGVNKLPHGYFVSLMDKKKRNHRIAIIPGEPNSDGFKVVSVIQDPLDYKATKVRISVGGETGMVEYDEKFLLLKKTMVASKKPTKPGARPVHGARPTAKKPSTIPGLNTKRPTTPPGTSSRTPRVRRVPTPPKR